MQQLTGIEYLKAEIACMQDKAYEKEVWDDRLSYFDSLDLSDPKTFKAASNPVGMRAAVQALQDTINNIPTGYMLSLDARSSGMQLLSLLVSCPTSYKLCGGVNTECVDSYVKIYDSMEFIGKMNLTRKEVKNTIMTSLYGSTSQPEQTFGNNVDMFYETMEQMAPGAWALNLALQELWGLVPDSEYEWVLPDNFHAYIETTSMDHIGFNFLGTKYEVPVKLNQRPKFHKGLGPNVIHSIDAMIVREMLRRCMFNPMVTSKIAGLIMKGANGTNPSKMVTTLWDHYLDTGFLSVRILDYLNEGNLGLVDPLVIAKMIQTLPDQPFDLVTVHDCFRCHPNYGNDVRKQYNTILADINDAKGLIGSVASQVAKQTIEVSRMGVIPRDTILNAEYNLA